MMIDCVVGAEGLEFSLRAFYYAQKALYVNNYSYHYLFNPNSISKKVDERNTNYLLDCPNVIQKDIEHFDRKDEFVQSSLPACCLYSHSYRNEYLFSSFEQRFPVD